MGLELLKGVMRVVDQGESSGLPATELGTETENGDLIFVGLVDLGELGTELVLGHVGSVGVEDVTGVKKTHVSPLIYRKPPKKPLPASNFNPILPYSKKFPVRLLSIPHPPNTPKCKKNGANIHDHLLAPEQRVPDELAGSDSDGVRHDVRFFFFDLLR